MKEEYYKDWVIKDNDGKISFSSIGIRGRILKRVEITRIGVNLYNLAFGDIQEDGSFNDSVITNNGDTIKLFATLYQIIEYYLKKYPDRELYFTGSSDSRIRLYRIIIGNNLDELKKKYSIFGINSLYTFSPFEKDSKYSHFIIKKLVV